MKKIPKRAPSYNLQKTIIIILALLIACPAYPQFRELFSVDKELSSSLINQVYQDCNNIIWIATEDGLNRYDGSKFIVYKTNTNDKNSLLNNYVRLLFEDSNRRLFVGSFDGLQRYDYATDTFTRIPLQLEDGDTIDAHVTTMLERYNGEILVGTSGHGLFMVKTDHNGIHANQISQYATSYLINYLYEDKDNMLWVSSQDKGIFCLGKNQKSKNYFFSKEISSICEDNEGKLYVGGLSMGFYVYNKSTNSFDSILLPGETELAIKTLYLSKSGEILIGTDGNGIKIFNPQKRKIAEGNFKIKTLDFSKSKVHSILEDKAGNVWLGIYQKGVVLLPNTTNNFKYIGHKSVKHNVIGTNNIISVFKDHEETLWVGTDGDGIYGLRADGAQKIHYKHTADGNAVPSTIFTIYEDSNFDLWVGSYLNGLATMNARTGRCTYVNNLLGNNAGHTPRIFSITEDADKNLWIGTMGSGIYCINLKTHEVAHYDATSGLDYRSEASNLHNSWVNHLLITKNGKLYIGTYDGLGCMDLKTRNFASTYGTNRLLPGQIIYTLYEDKQGTIWIGTSKGLINLNPKNQQTLSYTMDDGLPSNVICAIKEDTANNLWISTNYGISKMNLKNKNFINYYVDDGLQGNEFSKGAAFIDKEGQIIFGGTGGLTLFKPNEITDQGKKLKIRITDFYIHDQAVKKGMKSGPYDIITSSVMDAKTFHLSGKDNSFTIEFSTMEFGNPERIIYMYSMQSDNWITLRPGNNSVSYNNLAPGEYHFKVRAKDYNIYSDIKEISIIISPAWYFSLWAKATYCIIFLILIYLVALQVRQRYRFRQKMMEHNHAKQINEAKLQFFINIAHEIRTPMSLIISPLKKLIDNDRDTERQSTYLLMNRNSERILLLINQLMDIRKIDKEQMLLRFREVEIVAFINDFYHTFQEQTQAKQIELLYQHDIEQLIVWVDPNNFDKVILNVVSNALKFTPEKGKISIHLSTGENGNAATNELRHYFQIIISDSGIGISESEIARVFECFYQARQSKHNSSEGTGIGLYLTRSIVELHHGTITVENNIDGFGCRFIIRIPLGKNHLTPDEIQNNQPPDQKPEHLTYTLPYTHVGLEKIKTKSKTKYRVLIVDDDTEICQYICNELASDYHMTSCANGKEALSLALTDAPDLIISDIMMPEMDGVTLCCKIKQNVNINHIPIVLLTAKSEEEDTLKGLGIGADAYIVKPFNIEILNKTIQNIIKNREILRNNYTGNQQQKNKVKNITMTSADEKLLKKVMTMINENIGNHALNVEMISHEIGISRVHLHRKLKELTNQSTRDFVRNIRLQQAANLLANKHLNISEVAFAVGFTNVAHFSNAFKEFFGIPPTTYMEKHLKMHDKPDNFLIS